MGAHLYSRRAESRVSAVFGRVWRVVDRSVELDLIWNINVTAGSNFFQRLWCVHMADRGVKPGGWSKVRFFSNGMEATFDPSTPLS